MGAIELTIWNTLLEILHQYTPHRHRAINLFVSITIHQQLLADLDVFMVVDMVGDLAENVEDM